MQQEALRAPYAELRTRLQAAMRPFGGYVYPFESLHVTVTSQSPFTDSCLAAADRPAFERAWAEALSSARSSDARWPRAPFPLVFRSVRLDANAALFVIDDPTGAIAALRQLLEELARSPALAPYAAAAGMRSPKIVHSTILRFAHPPPAEATEEAVRAAFDEAVACWQPVTVQADALLLVREVVPFMHLEVGPGTAPAGAHADCVLAALPYVP